MRAGPAADATALRAALEDALTPKRDGTRHHRACLNRTVNASTTPCSDKCVRANALTAHERPLAEQQQRGLWEVAG